MYGIMNNHKANTWTITVLVRNQDGAGPTEALLRAAAAHLTALVALREAHADFS